MSGGPEGVVNTREGTLVRCDQTMLAVIYRGRDSDKTRPRKMLKCFTD